ncbi:MAG: T9SS type A sorting domain-containing protein [Saprospiraceae bacterium]
MKKFLLLTFIIFQGFNLLSQATLVGPPNMVVSCEHSIDIANLMDYRNKEFGDLVFDLTLRTPVASEDIVCSGYCKPDSITSYPGYVNTTSLPKLASNQACEYFNSYFAINDPFKKYKLVWGYSGFALGSPNLKINVNVEDLRECGKGKILRTFTLKDQGNSITTTQTIWIVNCYPIYMNVNDPNDPKNSFEWPKIKNLTVYGCGNDHLPSVDPPILKDTLHNCALISIEFRDEILSGNLAYCFKINRTWAVIDWCQYDPFVSSTFGRWEFTQEIIVIDTIKPLINLSIDPCYELNVNNNSQVKFEIKTTDNCTSFNWLENSYLIDINNDGIGNLGGYDCKVGPLSQKEFSSGQIPVFSTNPYSINNRNPLDPNGNYPLGTHKIVFITEDGCGNTMRLTKTFTIVSGEPPSIKCIGPPVATVMESRGFVTVWAQDLVANLTDNCDLNLIPSFSQDFYDSIRTYTCRDFESLGFPSSIHRQLKVWVKDKSGHSNSCDVLLEISNSNNICNSDSILVKGSFFTIANKPIDRVDYSITGLTLSTINGNTYCNNSYNHFIKKFDFPYSIIPTKIDQKLNGVDVWDIVKIRRYILGIELPSEPTAYLAADVNLSNNMTAVDLVEIQKVILATTSNFGKVDKYKWNFIRDSVLPINQINNSNIKIIGYKYGDVDGSALSQCSDSNKIFNPKLNFTLDTLKLNKSETRDINFYSTNFKNICCFQLDIEYDPLKLKINSIACHTNFQVISQIHKNHVSFIVVNPFEGLDNSISNSEIIFTINATTLENTNTSTLRFSNELTKSIAYNSKGEPLDICLNGMSTNVNPITISRELICFPNPFSQYFTIPWNEDLDGSKIEIFNTDGISIYHSILDFDLNINESYFTSPGLYLIKCSKEKNILTKKIIKI